MKKIITILLFLTITQIKAQDTLIDKCWTPEMDTTVFKNLPWYDDNDFLERFLDTIGYPTAGSNYRIVGTPVKYWIPIKFWVYRNDNGSGGPNPSQLQNLMDNLNRRFNETNNGMIGFYIKCDPTYINNTTHVTKTFTGASMLMASNNIRGAINVHIIGNFASNSAGFAISNFNAAMVPEGSYVDPWANGDLAHEVGHVLGLPHTHQFAALNSKCFTESVSRIRTWPTFNLCPTRILSNRVCESTGDGLRDTQADDNLLSNNSCFYNVTLGNDEWGDSYDNPPAGVQDRPNVRNIMSYNSATNCVDHFSRLQIAAMLWTIKWQKSYSFGWGNQITTFDNYEPDNESITARAIVLNENQERNFHQQYNFNSIEDYDYYSQCDIDWARFTPTCNGIFNVQTSAITGRTNANTRVTLFNSVLTQLAQNDDISSSNLFSSVSFNFVAGQTYFIRIENMNSNVTGYYNLNIGSQYSITGTSAFCTSSIYSVNNLPAGATVTWSASPAILQFSCNTPCSTVTASRLNDGNTILTATVTSACFSTPLILNRQISVGSAPLPATVNGPGNAIANAGYYFSLSTTPWDAIISNINWHVPSGWTISNGQGSRNVTIWTGNTTGDVEVDFDDACGVTRSVFKNVVIGEGGGDIQPLSNGGGLNVYPNPASDVITVILSEVQSKLNNNFIAQLKVINKMGKVLQHLSFNDKAKSKQINIAMLKPDVYTIQVLNNNTWQSIKFIKN